VGHLGDRARLVQDPAENLPASRGKASGLSHLLSRLEQTAVQPKHEQDHLGQDFAGRALRGQRGGAGARAAASTAKWDGSPVL
jgi:hypothetical protein